MGTKALLLTTALAIAEPLGASAATSFGAAFSADGFEAVAFEAPGCRYCAVFRRDVLPTYAETPVGKKAPLRFVDLNAAEASAYKLAAPITTVPTVVLLKDGVELGRIPGYVGRHNFHILLDHLLNAR